MAKFQNTTGFNQVVILTGKKRLVRKDGVIEARDDFMQVGFDKVPDDTPITVRDTSSKVVHSDEVQALVSRINDLEERINNDETLSQIEEKIQSVSQQALELGDDAVKDLQELRDLVASLNEAVSNQAEVVRSIKESEKVMLRRLDILKTAMQAMEMQVDEVMGYEEGN